MWKINRGFTLFELLIVVVVIGVVYFLLTPSFQSPKEEVFRFENLKQYLLENFASAQTSLVCLKECKECYVVAGDKVEASKISLEGLRAYFFNGKNFDTKEFYASKYFDPYEKVCFRYDVSKDGVSSEIFVEYDTKGYYFPPFFEQTKVYASIYEAQNDYEDKLLELRD